MANKTPPPTQPAYEFHPLASAFELLAGGEYRELIEDIRRHGLLEPIIIYEGKILARSTPELARQEILERVRRGDSMSVANVKDVIKTLQNALPSMPRYCDPASIRVRRETRLAYVLNNLQRDAKRMINDVRAALQTEDWPEIDPSLTRITRRAAKAWTQSTALEERFANPSHHVDDVPEQQANKKWQPRLTEEATQ
jgi:hypothetical protein